MIALQIALGIIAFLLLILLIPVRLSASFDGGLKARLHVLFFSYSLYPRPLKKKKKIKKGKKQPKEREELSQAEEMLREDGVGAVLSYYAEMTRLLSSAAKRLLRTITVDRLKVNIVIATDDASQTAVYYGRVCAVIYPAQALLESALHIKRRSINVTPNFMLDNCSVEGEALLHVLPLRVLWASVLFFIGYLGNTKFKKTVEQ